MGEKTNVRERDCGENENYGKGMELWEKMKDVEIIWNCGNIELWERMKDCSKFWKRMRIVKENGGRIGNY